MATMASAYWASLRSMAELESELTAFISSMPPAFEDIKSSPLYASYSFPRDLPWEMDWFIPFFGSGVFLSLWLPIVVSEERGVSLESNIDVGNRKYVKERQKLALLRKGAKKA